MPDLSTARRKFATAAFLLLLGLAPAAANAEVKVAEPTGDIDPALLAELKGSLETVAREAAPTDAVDAELRLAANGAEDGVSLVVELAPADGSETKRVARIASRASAVAQARAMARELLEPAAPASPPPTVVEVAQPPTPPRPATPRPPTRFRLESTAFAGLFWMGDVTEPTGGLDFGAGWSFAGRVGIGVRLAASWVSLSYSCTDGECSPIVDDSQRESANDDNASADFTDGYATQITEDAATTFLTLLFDLSFGNMELFYASVLAGVRCSLPTVGVGMMAFPFPYVGLGFTLTPLRHERVALLLRIDVGYYTAAALYRSAEDKGLEPHGAVGVQF